MAEEIKRIRKSFGHAFDGLKEMLKEKNFRVHLVFMILTLLLSFILQITLDEFAIILMTICIVFSAETLNTAVERICDTVRDELKLSYEATRIPRDLGAAAVFIVSFASIIVGLSIFLPRIIEKIFII